MRRYPSAFAEWLCAADFALGEVHEVAVLGELADSATQELLAPLWHNYLPRLVMAASAYPPAEGSPALLNDRELLNGKPTAYVCQDFLCQQPTHEAVVMVMQLNN